MKWLSIMDEFTRECLALEVERSITARDVIDLLELFIIRCSGGGSSAGRFE